jgi:hypothetical protein
MGEMKSGVPMDKLLKSSPPEFTQYFAHSRNLGFEDTPDYELLRSIFRGRMERETWEYDDHFDWLDRECLDGTLLPEEYRFDERLTSPPKSKMDLGLAYVFT